MRTVSRVRQRSNAWPRVFSLLGLALVAASIGCASKQAIVHDELLDLYARGAIRPLIDARVAMEEVPGAIASLADRGTAGKVVVEVASAAPPAAPA